MIHIDLHWFTVIYIDLPWFTLIYIDLPKPIVFLHNFP